jgi:hypothetical protein
MIMPGRSWVAGIAIAGYVSFTSMIAILSAEGGQATFSAGYRGSNSLFYTGLN